MFVSDESLKCVLMFLVKAYHLKGAAIENILQYWRLKSPARFKHSSLLIWTINDKDKDF